MDYHKKLQSSYVKKCDYITSTQNEYDRYIVTNNYKRLHGLPEKTPTTQTKTWNCTFVKNTIIIQRVVEPYIM
jgi:hypothetical protein